MNHLILSLLLALPPQAPPPQQAAPPIEWMANYDAARMESRTTGKPLLVFVTRPGCLPCFQMTHQVFPSEEVREALDAFVIVKVDAWQQPRLADVLKADQLPTFVMARPDGKVLLWWQGFTDSAEMSRKLRLAALPPQAPRAVDRVSAPQSWRTIRVACNTAWRHGGRSGNPVSHDCPKCGNHVTTVSRFFSDGSHEHVCNRVREVRVESFQGGDE